MTSAQDREAALFALAIEKPLRDRPAFLRAVCGTDIVLRQRLEELLAAHDQPDNLLSAQDDDVGLRENTSSFAKASEDSSAREARSTIKLQSIAIFPLCALWLEAINTLASGAQKLRGGFPLNWDMIDAVIPFYASHALQQEAREALRSQGIAVPETETTP